MWGQQLLLLRADVINLHANTHNFTVSFSDMPIISKRETFTTSSCWQLFFLRIINRNCPKRSKRKFSPLASKLVLEQCKTSCYFDEETFVWWFCVFTLSHSPGGLQNICTARYRSDQPDGFDGFDESDDFEPLQNNSLHWRDGQSSLAGPINEDKFWSKINLLLFAIVFDWANGMSDCWFECGCLEIKMFGNENVKKVGWST